MQTDFLSHCPERLPDMLSTLEDLPAELVLKILAHLPLQSLRALRLASRTWNAFFVDNECSIYHHAALLHRFIDSIHTLLPQAKEAHPLKFLQDAPDWLTYCKYNSCNTCRVLNPRSRQEVLPTATELVG